MFPSFKLLGLKSYLGTGTSLQCCLNTLDNKDVQDIGVVVTGVMRSKVLHVVGKALIQPEAANKLCM